MHGLFGNSDDRCFIQRRIGFIRRSAERIASAFSGNIDWILGLALAAGNSVGAWFAVKLAVRKGDRIVRAVMIVAILIMAAKILGLF